MENLDLLKQTAELISQSGMNIEELIKNSKVLESFLQDKENMSPIITSIINNDFVDFCSHLTTMNPAIGYVKIEERDYYSLLHNLISSGERRIFVKNDRQVGITTFWAAYSLFLSMKNRNTTTVYFDTRLGHFSEVIKNMIVRDLSGMIGIKRFDTDRIEFDNGSRIIMRAGSHGSTRGLTAHNIIIDNADYLKYDALKEILISSAPSLATSGHLLVSSHYSGKVDSVFYDYYSKCDTTLEIKR